ncbi:MAG: MFS transporter [Gammaproteobacteria bacterium]|nr:MFS transporter [Gammaproteobacteria bacterium]
MQDAYFDSALSKSARRHSLIAAISCVSIYSVTMGFSLPLISLILESRGVERSINGLLAATPSLAMLLVTPMIPRLIARAGLRPFLLACISADLVLFLMLPAVDHLFAWFVIRFFMGATIAGLFVAGETWINELAEEATRGRTVGVYAMVVAGGFALGPLLLPLTGIDGWLPFLAGSAFIALATVPLLLGRPVSPTFSRDPAWTVLGFFVLAPTICAAVMLAAFKDAAGMPLIPVYAVRMGVGQEAAALMLTVLGIGALALQIPLGWLADRMNRYALLVGCAASGAIGALVFALTIHTSWLIWVVLFLWGGAFSGVYTLALVILGERFRGAALATGNAAFGFCWGLGSLFGPAISGPAMDLWDPHGLPVTLCAASLLFLALALARRLLAARPVD